MLDAMGSSLRTLLQLPRIVQRRFVRYSWVSRMRYLDYFSIDDYDKSFSGMRHLFNEYIESYANSNNPRSMPFECSRMRRVIL